MLGQLATGLVRSQTLCVDESLTVPKLSPAYPGFADMPPVFATAFLVAFVEWVCVEALRPYLGGDDQSVGVHVDLSHAAATPLGMNVTARVELIAIDGSRLRFKVMCRDEVEVVSEGFHERYIIKRPRFDQRMSAKGIRASESKAGQASSSPDSHACRTAAARRLAVD